MRSKLVILITQIDTFTYFFLHDSLTYERYCLLAGEVEKKNTVKLICR